MIQMLIQKVNSNDLVNELLQNAFITKVVYQITFVIKLEIQNWYHFRKLKSVSSSLMKLKKCKF